MSAANPRGVSQHKSLETNPPGNNIAVFPANLVAQTANLAVLATGLKAKDTERLRNHHLLDSVIWGRDALENFESIQGSGTAGSLVGNHTTNGLVQDPGGSAEVEGTCRLCQSSIPSSSRRLSGLTHHHEWGCSG